MRPGFEGGQMPLQQRLPKVGFTNPFRKVYQVVNLADIAQRGLQGKISPVDLKKVGLIRSLRKPVKILGQGDVSEALQVKVQAVSASAKEKIIQAGGSVEIAAETVSEAE